MAYETSLAWRVFMKFTFLYAVADYVISQAARKATAVEHCLPLIAYVRYFFSFYMQILTAYVVLQVKR